MDIGAQVGVVVFQLSSATDFLFGQLAWSVIVVWLGDRQTINRSHDPR